MRWLLLTFMMYASWAQAVQIEMNTSDFLKAEVESALNLLPINYLDSVSKKITIEEAPLKSDSVFSEDLCGLDEDVKFGTTRKHKITISSRLIELAQKSTQSFDCSHGSFKKLLTAVIIHELTHLKDNAEKISVDADFQRIVGMKKVQKRSKKKLMNYNASTSPDAYEFKNLEEALAVNVEYLVLDSEFECRKPATASFLARKLGIPLKGQCSKNDKVITQSAFMEDNYQLAVSIDPKRIYQVHYLFAGKGEALMSRWGHAMFRLVVCAPFRKKAGPECLNDISHHLALSYRASMTDLSINYAKGMMGHYNSQLFVMRYFEVQQEYTKFGLRDLYSVPLKMTELQKKDFIDLTLERYWTYQGKYYFLDNNCGTETVKHLAVALTEEESRLIGSITPHKIFKDIIKESNNLTEGTIQGLSREEMIKKKILVPSMIEEFEEAYQFVRPYLSGPFTEKKFKKFIKNTKAEDRLTAYQNLKLENISDLKLKKQVVMKIGHLERYFASKFLMSLPNAIMESIEKEESLKEEILRMNEGMKLFTTQPWEVVDSLYGVPTQDEVESGFSQFIEKRRTQVATASQVQMEQLLNILGQSYFQQEFKEIEELKKITSLISKMMSQITVIN
ncbi:MAG: DUF4105 domain-containing protein [Bacteriovoracaceae bacterium]|nr:DUF4105 domain-containing protein [Bacteriovoracaceae bacterium]